MPMCQAHTCGQVRGPRPNSRRSKWKSDVHVKSKNSVSARSPLTKFKREKMRDSAEYKATVSGH